MVKITFKSWEEIVIHEVIKYESPKKFIEQKIMAVPRGIPIEPMLWANGILFSRSPMPPTRDVINEQLRGVIHYSAVEYAPMDKYRKSITQNGVTMSIMNVSSLESFRDVVKAIKERENK